MFFFLVELISDRFDELLASLLGVGLWSVCGYFPGKLQVQTHFESAQVGLEKGLVGGAEVLLDTRLGQAVCDAADKGLVSGESLKVC